VPPVVLLHVGGLAPTIRGLLGGLGIYEATWSATPAAARRPAPRDGLGRQRSAPGGYLSNCDIVRAADQVNWGKPAPKWGRSTHVDKPSDIRNAALKWAFLKNKNKTSGSTSAPRAGDDRLVLTSAQVEGPFYLSSPIRSDISEDRAGVPFHLLMEVINVETRQPVPNAIVDIWHCDASGIYSGYPEGSAHDFVESLKFTGVAGMLGEKHIDEVNEKRFLRGAQQTDADGLVVFQTIFPGWYEPRATHIHFKVIVNNVEHLTSQLYFDQDLCDEIYTTIEPYSQYGKDPYSVENDLALRNLKQIDGVLLTPNWRDDKTRLECSVRIGVR